ncbi:hypothetical protein [Streptomyces virginiae]|uniref:hypothetical protein n=1 Tax=Streptomyces virginiae TaxID=1961 RepID=UPI0036F9479A
MRPSVHRQRQQSPGVFVRVLCLDWLTTETCTRAELRDTCAGALLGALRPFLRDEIP